MNILIYGGLQKNSFIDFPGKISCVLYTMGCNFNCPYCHNPQLKKMCDRSEDLIEENTVAHFLEQRKPFLEGVVISGGEPTLHENLAMSCENIKRLGYPIKLDTNGSHPEVLEELIGGGLIDYIAMDIKSDPCQYSTLITKHPQSKAVLTSIQLVMESGMPYEFRTTCVKPFVNSDIIVKIVQQISGAMLYVLQRFRHRKVLSPDFFDVCGPGCLDHEMDIFRSLAEPWVQSCIIR